MKKNKESKKIDKLNGENEKTLENITKNMHEKKECEINKILNIKTGRCVKKEGRIGKNIMKKGTDWLKENQKTEKKCQDDKILNRKTQRCVKKKGIIGKKILEQSKEKKENKEENKEENGEENGEENEKKRGNRKERDFDLLNKRYINKTEYVGYPDIEYNAILYLLKKHKSCTVLPNKIDVNRIKFVDFQLRWMCDNNKRILAKPKYFGQKLKKCYNAHTRFIFVLLSMTNKYTCSKSNNQGHLNVIIYDRIEKSIERFEPMGNSNRFEIYSKKLDNIILNLFGKYIPILSYYSPLDFCPALSFQSLEIKSDTLQGDPGGFCSAWSLWYLDLRLSNPTLSREKIVSFALNKISILGSFKNFIRNYSHFLYSESFHKN